MQTSQGACLPELAAGDRWLFYLRQEKGQPIFLDYYGNDSLPVAKAQERIEILRRLKTIGDYGILRGHVLRGEFYDGAPVSNARVVARRKSDKRKFVTRTDGDGHYELDPLPPGEYKVTVDRIDSFKPDSNDMELSAGACWDSTIAKKSE